MYVRRYVRYIVNILWRIKGISVSSDTQCAMCVCARAIKQFLFSEISNCWIGKFDLTKIDIQNNICLPSKSWMDLIQENIYFYCWTAFTVIWIVRRVCKPILISATLTEPVNVFHIHLNTKKKPSFYFTWCFQFALGWFFVNAIQIMFHATHFEKTCICNE